MTPSMVGTAQLSVTYMQTSHEEDLRNHRVHCRSATNNVLLGNLELAGMGRLARESQFRKI